VCARCTKTATLGTEKGKEMAILVTERRTEKEIVGTIVIEIVGTLETETETQIEKEVVGTLVIERVDIVTGTEMEAERGRELDTPDLTGLHLIIEIGNQKEMPTTAREKRYDSVEIIFADFR
jgi:hypothetical protein